MQKLILVQLDQTLIVAPNDNAQSSRNNTFENKYLKNLKLLKSGKNSNLIIFLES